MASTSTCIYCGAVVRSDEKTCPKCGGSNPFYVVDKPRKIFHPTTIGELKEYCAERGMPLVRMRFFIGEDYREAKAFGIYQEGENRFIVYKNKADGTRAVRYDGPDEAYAVNELFEKLLSECHNRGIYPDGAPAGSGTTRSAGGSGTTQTASGRSFGNQKKVSRKKLIAAGVVILAIVIFFLSHLPGKNSENQQKNADEALIRLQVSEFTDNPNTYNSKEINGKYYTYNVATGETEESDERQNSLNNGYYRQKNQNTDSPEYAVFYRDNGAWYEYIEDEKDWRYRNKELPFQGSDIWLGAEWQEEWNIPDIQKFPLQDGYYVSDTGSVYLRSRKTQWFAYRSDLPDWEKSVCPVKLGVPAEQLKYVETDEEDKNNLLPEGVIPYTESSYYAFICERGGYYQQGEDYFFCLVTLTGDGPWSRQDWYSFNNETETWRNTSKPDPNTRHISYLGLTYLEELPVTNFKNTAIYGSLSNTNGYYRQEEKVYYYYKNKWYSYDSDIESWTPDTSPAYDDIADVYLGNTYETNWDDDWNTTNFKTSTTWADIEAKEKKEQEDRERQDAIRKNNQYNNRNDNRNDYGYDSDYDDWDMDDTDWDTDW